MKSPSEIYISKSVSCLQSGKVIAYPTESCFGLGCDPNNSQAINDIYELKSRPARMPFIIIISQWAHLNDFDCVISVEQRKLLTKSWPGPTTWLIPLRKHHMLASKEQKIAVRMTEHSIAKAICDHWHGAIVSTSANPHGLPSAKTAKEVDDYFGNKISYVFDGPIGSRNKPSDIFDLETNQQLR
ncbi:MAG: L-threonylcarbamoyladenylate synthase [Pseudomonadota bacterium]|nr:L-threonylcarbamoyladenylate synthase [Pseudomonadota bacterium]